MRRRNNSKRQKRKPAGKSQGRRKRPNVRQPAGVNSAIVSDVRGQQVGRRGFRGCNFWETASGPLSVPVAGEVGDLCLIPQGVTREERIADFVKFKALQVNYSISSQNADVYNSVRFVIFQWNPNSVPTFVSVFQNNSSTVYPFYQWDNAQEYRILYDRVYSLSGTATAPTQSGNVHSFFTIPFRRGGLNSRFVAGTTAGTNHLYYAVIGDSAATPFPQLLITTRLIYKNDI